MTEHPATPAVALLFADVELGAQLRETLVSFGARIVHEGPAAHVSRDTLTASGADVVVVNLEPAEENQLEHLYAALDDGPYQVVFNDADASRNLSGWDRARWARHLAAKLLGHHDVDPPRPVDTPMANVDSRAAVTQSPVTTPIKTADLQPPALDPAPEIAQSMAVAATPDVDHTASLSAAETADEASLEFDLPAMDADELAPSHAAESVADAATADQPESVEDTMTFLDGAQNDVSRVQQEPETDAIQSEQLAAELEALLVESEAAEPAHVVDEIDAEPIAPVTSPVQDTAAEAPSLVLDVEDRQVVAAPAPAMEWELEDMNAAPPVAPPTQPSPGEFGIEKMDAADYLKPEASDDASPVEAGLHLELVSLEESLAPSISDEPVSEMLLGEGTGGIRRVVVVAAGHDGVSEVGAFLAGLPVSLSALLLLVLHQPNQHATELAAALDTTTRLPVSVASDAGVSRHGQVCLVPAGYSCTLDRSGRMRLIAATDTVLGNPSIDACLALSAKTFASDLTAVVLAGTGRDALAGVQEVHDAGGHVWVQDPAACGADSMVAAVHAEGLATFSGSPTELARHLCEAYA